MNLLNILFPFLKLEYSKQQMKQNFLFILLILLLGMAGCTVDRSCIYKVDDFGAVSGDSSVNTTVAVYRAVQALSGSDSAVSFFFLKVLIIFGLILFIIYIKLSILRI